MQTAKITAPKRSFPLFAALALCAGAAQAQADDHAIDIWLNDQGSESDADGGPIMSAAGEGEIREGENRTPVFGYRRGMDLRMSSLAFPAQMIVIDKGVRDYARHEIPGGESGFQTYHGQCEGIS
ncbi:MAG: hypothetical protein Q4G26_07920 [Paracoccus sp. (in: a-proteobacteria)]|nr:hypothetical protein [Paracoccus sp. (in: a-proteobacteria)]